MAFVKLSILQSIVCNGAQKCAGLTPHPGILQDLMEK
jgi:hypothetical protein